MIRSVTADKLQVQIYATRQEMGAAAAVAIAAAIRERIREKGEVNMIFAAAPSQQEMLEALREEPLDWSRVRAFHMDEYIGLPEEAPQRFARFLHDALFFLCPFRSVHYIRGDAPDPEAECRRYSELLEAYPPDIVCLGIGENGHLAFNDPPVADFQDPVLVKQVELDPACRQQQVNDGCFEKLEDVPTHALTLTIPALMKGRKLFCVVPGKTKINAVYDTLYQPCSTYYPSTILRTHDRAILFLDQVSASLIK